MSVDQEREERSVKKKAKFKKAYIERAMEQLEDEVTKAQDAEKMDDSLIVNSLIGNGGSGLRR